MWDEVVYRYKGEKTTQMLHVQAYKKNSEDAEKKFKWNKN